MKKVDCQLHLTIRRSTQTQIRKPIDQICPGKTEVNILNEDITNHDMVLEDQKENQTHLKEETRQGLGRP